MTTKFAVRMFEFCDVATIRGGLMTVVNGGITQMPRDSFPSQMGAFIAVAVEVTEFDHTTELRLRVTATNENAPEREIPSYEWSGPIAAPTPDERGALILNLAIDARSLRVEAPGSHRFDLELNDETVTSAHLEAFLAA